MEFHKGMAMQRLGDILVVEDEAPILSLVVELLEEEGYQVRSASNGTDALDAIAQQQPALILMDMYMPQMNGSMLLDHLQHQGIDGMPIILMTASPSAAEQVMSQGSVDYLPKPFDIDQLLAAVARYLEPPGN